MIRQSFLSALIGLLVVSLGVAAGDPAPDQPEPPVRLKKKEKKAAPKPEEKPQPPQKEKEKAKQDKAKQQPEPEPEPADPAQDEKEILDRVAKNMRDSEKRLSEKDAGEGTQQLQRDIVKDLEALLRHEQQQSEQENQQQDQQQQRGGQTSNSRRQRIQQVRRRTIVRRRQQQQQTARAEQKQNQPQQNNSKQGGMGGKSQGPTNKLAELYKDVWGHLPEQLRMEMDAYSREQFMAKYNELLKQYYATIAEKGRRKGD